jgi:hypothetical protein
MSYIAFNASQTGRIGRALFVLTNFLYAPTALRQRSSFGAKTNGHRAGAFIDYELRNPRGL